MRQLELFEEPEAEDELVSPSDYAGSLLYMVASYILMDCDVSKASQTPGVIRALKTVMSNTDLRDNLAFELAGRRIDAIR